MKVQELLDRYAVGERDFQGVDLREADLRRADLTGARLCGANLSCADLLQVRLVEADLRQANLSDAHLPFADLRWSRLQGANLSLAHLHAADLSGAELGGANCDRASLSSTMLADLELGPLCTGHVFHRGPSPIDWKSVAKSIRSPMLKEFLLAAGMPPLLAEYMMDCCRSLDPIDLFSIMQSTFISYGGPDESFARKLHEALQSNGVTTFFFAEHALPGQKLHRLMRNGVNEHDRVILICSETSLDRRGVLNEIEETLARESRDGGAAYLIPIRLDDYLFSGWNPPNPDVAQAIKDRVVADFRGTEADDAKFGAQLVRLLGALKKKP